MTLLELLEQGIKWIYDPPEFPETALMSHHGIHSDEVVKLSNGRPVSLAICQRGRKELPVIIVHVADVIYSPGEGVTNPFIEEEIQELTNAIDSVLHDYKTSIVDEWNGLEHDCGSFQPGRAADRKVTRLVDLYHKGCPHEGEQHDHRSVFCKCGWDKTGRTLVDGPEGWQI
jgi:hypothetical protein